MHNNWLFVRVHYIVIIILLHINIASYCQWCLDGSDSPDKQNFNRQINMLNEKRIHDDEKKKVHMSCRINNISYLNLT